MKFNLTLFIALLVLGGLGCTTTQEAVDETVSDSGITQEYKAIPEPPQPPLIQDQEGIPNLYLHNTHFAKKSAGGDWELGEDPIAQHASVPDLLVLHKEVGSLSSGDLISIFVNTEPVIDGEDETVAFVTSTDDGESWSQRTNIILDQANLLPVDPSLVQLEDGRLRLHFFDFTAGRLAGTGQEVTYEFYSAISEDGVNFTVEDVLLSSKSLMTDPEVVAFGDQWLMYFARHEGEDRGIWVATSEDGIHFQDEEKVEVFDGIPGAMVYAGQVYLYGCDFGGITEAVSDDGLTFESTNGSSPILTVGGLLCDPSPAVLSDGSFGLVVKKLAEN
jgi:hypothetical protein